MDAEKETLKVKKIFFEVWCFENDAITVSVGFFVNKLSDITTITPKMIPIPAPTHGTRTSSV